MCDRPTCWEYRFVNQDGYVRTKDGRFFKAEEGKAAKWISFGLVLAIFAAYIGLYFMLVSLKISLQTFNFVVFDLFLFIAFTNFLERWLKYRLTRYLPIQEGSDDDSTAQSKVYQQTWLRKAASILAIALWVFAALNSNGAMLLYSAAADDVAIAEATVSAYEQDAFSVAETDVVYLRHLSSAVTLGITVTKATHNAEFYLDGQPLADHNASSGFAFHFFWEEHYPRNEYHVWLSDVCDGSVLTMDCGDIHREWTFTAAQS